MMWTHHRGMELQSLPMSGWAAGNHIPPPLRPTSWIFPKTVNASMSKADLFPTQSISKRLRTASITLDVSEFTKLLLFENAPTVDSFSILLANVRTLWLVSSLGSGKNSIESVMLLILRAEMIPKEFYFRCPSGSDGHMPNKSK